MTKLYVQSRGQSPFMRPDPKVRWAIRVFRDVSGATYHVAKNVLLWRKAHGLSWEPSAIRVVE